MNTPLATIENDAFCDGCGFNLRTQPIWRDERLRLLVCRCPECGAYQSAVGRASALSPWLNRLALLAAMLWVGIGIAVVATLFMGSFGVQLASVEGLTNQMIVTPDGRPVTLSYANGTQSVVAVGTDVSLPREVRLVQQRTLVPLFGGPTIASSNWGGMHDLTWLGVGLFAGAALVATYFAGAMLASLCWFWRPRRRFVWLIVPACAVALSFSAMKQDGLGSYLTSTGYHFADVDRLGQSVILAVLALQIATLTFGLATGRRLARGVLLVFCPPGVRQLFAFLWHCDGKSLPVIAGTAPSRTATPPNPGAAAT